MNEVLEPLVKYGLLALGAAGMISAVWVRARKAIKAEANLERAIADLEALEALDVRGAGSLESSAARRARLQRIVREAEDNA